jgi:hypothetical protein
MRNSGKEDINTFSQISTSVSVNLIDDCGLPINEIELSECVVRIKGLNDNA